jgi:glycosyltransferase involved in cell wall biosynthesis
VVHLLGSFPAEQMPDFFAHADAMLVSLKTDPVFTLTVPAKVQAYMACGRPIVAMLDGEGARIIAEAGAGIAVSAGNATGLADAVQRLAGMSSTELRRMGEKAVEYNNANFSRDRLFEQLEAWMKPSAGRSPPADRGKSGTIA